MKAAERIAAIRQEIDKIMPGKGAQRSEQRYAAHAACDFADQLRRRRNDASHAAPTYGFGDREEIEEFLVSAGRHLPNLWRLQAKRRP